MVAVENRRAPRPYVDFASVPVSQWKIHDRLENWARCVRGRDRQSGTVGCPMFSLYRSTEAKRAYGESTSVAPDLPDAVDIAKGVQALPEKHRHAINWAYLRPKDPAAEAARLGLTLQGLADMVRDGRQMLINRGV